MTDEIYETPSTTPNFQTELAAQLADLIPEAIADGKVDVEKLKELLDGDAADSSERFGLFWPGKKRALRAAQEPTTATLKPDFENSKNWETTQNVFIEGDNLEVLKILQKHYHAKIKLIYIDPPYNTGHDFVYPDNYREGLDTYLEWTRQVNSEGKRLTTNAETDGRFHSNWLNMMLPRLKLARNLLTDDGLIAISIDESEVAALRFLLDELFGHANFIEQIAWKNKYGSGALTKGFANVHEYVMVYSKRPIESIAAPLTDEQRAAYSKRDEHFDVRGGYVTQPLATRSKDDRPNLVYPILHEGTEIWPHKQWIWSRERVEEAQRSGELVFSENKGAKTVRVKQYLRSSSGVERLGKPLSLLIGPFNQAGNRRIEELFEGNRVFDFPKPVGLIKYLLAMRVNEDESADHIVLDFFAGSGSTADAVMQLNREDGGARKFIQVQLPEPIASETPAGKAGFATIAEVARRRIDLAGDLERSRAGSQSLDVGYRSYRLADTNFSKWRLSSDVEEGALQQHLLSLRDSATDDATADDLLTEILLKQGYSLTEDIAPAEIGGLDVRLVRDRDGDIAVLAYLNEHVKPTLEQLRALVDESPTRIIVLEDAFQGDDELKTNLAQLAKSKGIELWTA